MCVEISQGNSLCSYLYLKLAKSHVFLLTFSSFAKLENRRAKQGLRGGGLPRTRLGGEWWGKRVRG
jgi:hypothetical protein